MPLPGDIDSGIQLLVEGNDQRNFFEAFKAHLSLPNIQIQNFGGVDELRTFLPALVNMARFHTVSSVGIVRDAEESGASAFQSVQSSLRNAGLSLPDRPEERTAASPAVTVMILPGGAQGGMLETLLCETFEGSPMDGCIDGFFACAEALPGSVARSDKARAHAYLATQAKPHLSVGVAAKNGYWDLNHSAFGSVRSFLGAL